MSSYKILKYLDVLLIIHPSCVFEMWCFENPQEGFTLKTKGFYKAKAHITLKTKSASYSLCRKTLKQSLRI